MKFGKNTGTRQNATFATKVLSKTCIVIQWLFMILIQENTVAKVIGDATIRWQKINMLRMTLENQKMKKIRKDIRNEMETEFRKKITALAANSN